MKKIDTLNKQAWEFRYADTDKSLIISQEALEQSSKAKYTKGTAYAKLNLGICQFLRSENQEALELLTGALKYFEKHEHEKGLSLALTFIGNIYEGFGDYETALRYCQTALKKAQEIEYKEGEGEAQSVIGLIYSRLADLDRALDAYTAGLVIRTEQEDHNAVASSLNRIARIYTLKKEFEKALEYYEKSMKLRMEAGQSVALSWTYLGLASTYEDMGDMKNAGEYYRRNLEKSNTGVDMRCRQQCLLGLGRVYHRLNQNKEALEYFTESLEAAKDLEAKPLLFASHLALADHYESMRNPEIALVHYREFQRIKEEVQSIEVRNRLKNQQIAFAVEKAEKEKEIFQLRNVELKAAYDEINQKNEEITASINYASRIQAALLPQKELMEKSLPDHFILFLPKDVVSGDFYWVTRIAERIIFTAADCTGHGVPGAMMSMLGISFLNEIINSNKVSEPGRVLDQLRMEVISALRQTGSEKEQKDGMDIALCAYDTESNVLEFAGANNPLYLVRNNSLEEIKADSMPVGYYEDIDEPFATRSINIKKGDMIYLFSDGFVDQFGGPDRKRFKQNRFKDLIMENHHNPVPDQMIALENSFNNWKGKHGQMDDVLVIGVRF